MDVDRVASKILPGARILLAARLLVDNDMIAILLHKSNVSDEVHGWSPNSHNGLKNTIRWRLPHYVRLVLPTFWSAEVGRRLA